MEHQHKHQSKTQRTNTHLSKQITKKPTDKGGESLHRDGLLIQRIRISLESRNGPASRDGGVAEQGAHIGGVLLSKRRLVGDKRRLGKSLGLGDNGGNPEGLRREARRDDDGGEELHG